MKNIKQLILILALVISGQLKAQEILNSYLEQAANNNPGLKATFNEYMAALEVAPQISGLPDPQFAFGYFIRPIETKAGPQQAKFSIHQAFPWFGNLQANEDAALQMAEAKYELFKEAKSRLFYEVRSTYYNLYFTEKAFRITEENISILNTFRNLALIRFESGTGSAVDELRIEMEIADLENQLAILHDNFRSLSIEFNHLLNVESNRVIHIPESLWINDMIYDKQSIADSILNNNHQLLNLDYQIESLVFKEKSANKTGLPKMSLGLDYFLIGKDNNANIESSMNGKDAILFPKIGITIPIYRNKYKSMVNETVYLQQAKNEEKINKQNVLKSVFENGWKEYLDASRRIDLYVKQTGLANGAMEILHSEYATSGKDFEEVLRMEKRLLKYALEQEKAITDKQAAIAFITYLMGE